MLESTSLARDAPCAQRRAQRPPEASGLGHLQQALQGVQGGAAASLVLLRSCHTLLFIPPQLGRGVSLFPDTSDANDLLGHKGLYRRQGDPRLSTPLRSCHSPAVLRAHLAHCCFFARCVLTALLLAHILTCALAKDCFAWKGESLESPRAVVTACLKTSL